jgi:hypothetical protein
MEDGNRYCKLRLSTSPGSRKQTRMPPCSSINFMLLHKNATNLHPINRNSSIPWYNRLKLFAEGFDWETIIGCHVGIFSHLQLDIAIISYVFFSPSTLHYLDSANQSGGIKGPYIRTEIRRSSGHPILCRPPSHLPRPLHHLPNFFLFGAYQAFNKYSTLFPPWIFKDYVLGWRGYDSCYSRHIE